MKTDSFFKKLLPFTLTLLATIILTSCEKDGFPDPSTLPKGLTGSWVETNTKSDTIVFNSNDNSGIFYLSRGFSITNGYNLPTIGSTWYMYNISGESISLTDVLSSSMSGGTYPFKFDEQNLTISIEKFSQYINTKKSTLTFRKIK
jgi:hypothetical protein